MIKIPITQATLKTAIGNVLEQHFPDAVIHKNPTLETTLPAWYIDLIPTSRVEKQLSWKVRRYFTFNLTYRHDYHLPNLFDLYGDALELLDEIFLYLPYPYIGEDGEEKLYLMPVFVQARDYNQERLLYQIELRPFAFIDLPDPPLFEEIEELNIQEKIIEEGD